MRTPYHLLCRREKIGSEAIGMQDDRRVETDWAGLWRELCEVSRQREAAEDGQDAWTGRSRRHHARTTRRWAKPDSTRQTIAAMLAAAPGAAGL